ncbi:unnamed protein product [Haemonchus placei]|uniref:Secreted protein n=1 Tax=Haemonchus placei TaxID=6290 RepID=A0A0N4VYX6_HAEPC|nr:unnamed protein product [Haemonchus placei]
MKEFLKHIVMSKVQWFRSYAIAVWTFVTKGLQATTDHTWRTTVQEVWNEKIQNRNRSKSQKHLLRHSL